MKKLVFSLLATILMDVFATAQFNNDDYGIYLKGTELHIEGYTNDRNPGTSMVLSNSRGSGLFKLISLGNNLYKLKIGDNLFLSLKYQVLTRGSSSINESTNNTSGFMVVQDNEYEIPSKPIADISTPRPAFQQWRITKVAGEEDTYYIRSVAFPDKELVASNNTNGAGLKISTISTGNKDRKWIIKSEQID